MANEASMAHKRQGDQHLAQGALDQAARCYALAVECDPSHADAFVNLGYVRLEANDFAAARPALESARRLAPQVADVHFLLGELAAREGRSTDAETHYAATLELRGDFEHAYRALFAVLLQQAALPRAEALMQRAVATFPQSAEFHFNLANLLEARGDHDGAIREFNHAIAMSPDVPQFHNNLGAVFSVLERHDDAASAFGKALAIDPGFVPARIGMGNAMLKRSAGVDAAYHFKRVVDADPVSVEGRVGLASALELSGKAVEAIETLRQGTILLPSESRMHLALGAGLLRQKSREAAMQALQTAATLAPNDADVSIYMGNAHMEAGEKDQALACFRRAMALRPESGVAHLVAMLEGASPDRAPSEYVAALFDQYADKFDSHLVQGLSYSVPEKMVTTLRELRTEDLAAWRVLDLGCGTGLIASALGPGVGLLVGVDLSGKMLDKARALHLYHRLEQAELVAMMSAEADLSYTVVIAADVLVYFGSIDALVREAKRLLPSGGLLAFSVEELTADASAVPTAAALPDFVLRDTGRYAHTSTYIERLAAEAGFTVVALQRIVGRVNQGKPVASLLVVLKA